MASWTSFAICAPYAHGWRGTPALRDGPRLFLKRFKRLTLGRKAGGEEGADALPYARARLASSEACAETHSTWRGSAPGSRSPPCSAPRRSRSAQRCVRGGACPPSRPRSRLEPMEYATVTESQCPWRPRRLCVSSFSSPLPPRSRPKPLAGTTKEQPR